MLLFLTDQIAQGHQYCQQFGNYYISKNKDLTDNFVENYSLNNICFQNFKWSRIYFELCLKNKMNSNIFM